LKGSKRPHVVEKSVQESSSRYENVSLLGSERKWTKRLKHTRRDQKVGRWVRKRGKRGKEELNSYFKFGKGCPPTHGEEERRNKNEGTIRRYEK